MNKNVEMIKKAVESAGYIIGCIDAKGFEGVTKPQMKKVLNVLGEEYTDIIISKNRRKHVVEVSTVDNEKDIHIYSKDEYINKYGLLTWEELLED